MTSSKPKVSFVCPGCNRNLQAKAQLAGRVVACSCGQKLIVPANQPAAQKPPTTPTQSTFDQAFPRTQSSPGAPAQFPRSTGHQSDSTSASPTASQQKAKKTPKSRDFMLILIGATAGLVSAMFVLLMVVGAIKKDVLIFASGFVVTLASGGLSFACFIPKYRTLAIRSIGCVGCVGCIGLFFAMFLMPNPPPNVRRRGLLLVGAAGFATVAVKGRWPE